MQSLYLNLNVDEQDETLKNELTIAIVSAKTELLKAINTKADAETVNAKIAELEEDIASIKAELSNNQETDTETVNAKIAELEASIDALTNELDSVNQKTEKLESQNGELQILTTIVCSISGIALCGFGAFMAWFFIDRKKKA